MHQTEPLPPGRVELLFLGTGTSAGIPMIGCHCDVCRSIDPRDKRNRCSVIVRYAGTQVLIDTTPELRLQCITHHIDIVDAVVLTHAHADHIMGLDDLRRFNAIKQGPLDVWADARTHESATACFGYAFKEPPPELKVFRPHLVRRYVEGPFEINGAAWTPIPLMHGTLPILGFRVGNLAYCTDTDQIPEPSFDLLRGLDVLVLDGLQWKTHATHFSIDQAIAAARRIGAKQTFLTHMSHQVGHAETSARLPEGVTLAYDGLSVAATM
jgi:phosphoribosyl 1,2-cyclic phosphate phosphodiesterase